MLRAIWFSIHFAIIFLGLIIAIHFDTWLGVALMGVFTVKFMLMLPDLNERTDI
jgi:hypothetical protein